MLIDKEGGIYMLSNNVCLFGDHELLLNFVKMPDINNGSIREFWKKDAIGKYNTAFYIEV